MKYFTILFFMVSFSTRSLGELIPLWSANLYGEEIKYFINRDRLKKLEYHNILEGNPPVDLQSAVKTAMKYLTATQPKSTLSFYEVIFSDYDTDFNKINAYEVKISLRENGGNSVRMMHVYILMDGKILNSMSAERFRRRASSEVIFE